MLLGTGKVKRGMLRFQVLGKGMYKKVVFICKNAEVPLQSKMCFSYCNLTASRYLSFTVKNNVKPKNTVFKFTVKGGKCVCAY